MYNKEGSTLNKIQHMQELQTKTTNQCYNLMHQDFDLHWFDLGPENYFHM